jgi:hypothetical protein
MDVWNINKFYQYVTVSFFTVVDTSRNIGGQIWLPIDDHLLRLKILVF